MSTFKPFRMIVIFVLVLGLAGAPGLAWAYGVEDGSGHQPKKAESKSSTSEKASTSAPAREKESTATAPADCCKRKKCARCSKDTHVDKKQSRGTRIPHAARRPSESVGQCPYDVC